MCRRYVPFWDSCTHYDPIFNYKIKCDKFPACGPAEVIPLFESGWCYSQCLAHGNVAAPGAPQPLFNHNLGRGDRSEFAIRTARSIFDLAAEPESQFLIVPDELSGQGPLVLDSNDIHALSRDVHGPWGISSGLGPFEVALVEYITNTQVPNLTTNELRLFCQIRAARVAVDAWREEPKPKRPDWLDLILTPIPTPKGDPECLCCREVLGVPNAEGKIEKTVKLPCNHFFGDDCIAKIAENTFLKCPMCRREHRPPAEVEHTRPWWHNAFYAIWEESWYFTRS